MKEGRPGGETALQHSVTSGEDYVFSGWSGDYNGSENSYSISSSKRRCVSQSRNGTS
ncbi:MAG: hypothetical protein ACLFQB_08350 [Chitinispirillaceae bacterium]